MIQSSVMETNNPYMRRSSVFHHKVLDYEKNLIQLIIAWYTTNSFILIFIINLFYYY